MSPDERPVWYANTTAVHFYIVVCCGIKSRTKHAQPATKYNVHIAFKKETMYDSQQEIYSAN